MIKITVNNGAFVFCIDRGKIFREGRPDIVSNITDRYFIHGKGKDDLWIVLPTAQWIKASFDRCDCDVCGGDTGYWDTICVNLIQGCGHLIHWPEKRISS